MTTAADREGESFQTLQCVDLHAQLFDRSRGGGFVEDFLFGRFQFAIRGVFEIFDVLLVEKWNLGRKAHTGLATALEYLQLAQTALKPFPGVASRTDR